MRGLKFSGLVLSCCALCSVAAAQRIGPPPTTERVMPAYTPLDVKGPATSPSMKSPEGAFRPANESRSGQEFSVRTAGAELPLAPPAAAPLPLKPRQEGPRAALANPVLPTMPAALGTVAGSLGIVLGVFLLLVVCFRRFSPAAGGSLPKEAVELLGRVSLSPKQHLQLVRLGNKLVLVALSPSGAAPLAEVTDAAEVEQLTALCRRGGRGSSAAEFRQVLTQFAAEPAPAGFVGRTAALPATSNARGGR